MENNDVVVFTVIDRIMLITINRPKALNALNTSVFDALEYFFITQNSKLSSYKGVIITGEGDKAFVAGADIAEFTSLSGDGMKKLSARGTRIFQAIEESPVPVIAAVNGFALGGGLELAMACHLRVATQNAKFGLPETTLGILPGYGGTQRLTQLVGKGRALHMMLTADMIEASIALKFGLANEVVLLGEEIDSCQKIIENISGKGPLAISAVIDTVNAYFDGRRDGYETENNYFGDLGQSEDFKEGVAAFLAKRRPSFIGK